jgi:hypothetical protein
LATGVPSGAETAGEIGKGINVRIGGGISPLIDLDIGGEVGVKIDQLIGLDIGGELGGGIGGE